LARRLINENEIAAICQSLGLRVVSPESMSLRDQAILFRSCCTIVGVKGASLTNALFCAPSTHVVALSPGDFPDPFFWDVVAQQGGAYSEMFGKVTEHCGRQGGNPFYINPNKFGAVLQNCLAEIPD
jgi:capsular polysaccharide biosynthesis protein